jgi:hypothetical protein
MASHWSDSQQAELMEQARKGQPFHIEGKSLKACETKAYRMMKGVPSRPRQPWTPAEEEYLIRQFHQHHGNYAAMDLSGRTPDACRKRISQIVQQRQ